MKILRFLLFIVLLFNIGMSRNAIAILGMDCSNQSFIPLPECTALIDIYVNTNGPEWTRSDNWKTHSDPCTLWYGVTCEQGSYCTPTNPPLCYVTNRVWSLELRSNNLNGAIPFSISNLTYLDKLFLYDNQLSGSIPSSIGDLTT